LYCIVLPILRAKGMPNSDKIKYEAIDATNIPYKNFYNLIL